MTLGSHQQSVGKSQTWITPKWIIDALGPFDLDPCAAFPRPWNCASINVTEGGLGPTSWRGRVWLNPPFDRREVAKWVRRLADHGEGTALLHARTEAEWFEPVWQKAWAILFLADRLYFHYPDGRRPARSREQRGSRLSRRVRSPRCRPPEEVGYFRGSCLSLEHPVKILNQFPPRALSMASFIPRLPAGKQQKENPKWPSSTRPSPS